MGSKPRLYLIDGHALAYRTYFALTGAGGSERWMTQNGEPTAGVYGFTSVLLRLLEQDRPEYLAVAFDTGRTFRDDIFPEYKATREKMPEDLEAQFERIRQVVSAFDIPILEAEGYEADDVLGTVARQAAQQGVEVVILTGDRDLLQLADEHITIRLAGNKLSEAKDYGPQDVQQKYGLEPAQIVDYKALVGDPSDNIPGVRGIGEKTAVKLLRQYGDLDNIYQHLDEIPTRFRKRLEEGRDSAYLSRKLAAIVTAVPVPFDLQACHARQFDRQQVVSLFRELEFRSLLGRLPDDRDEGQQLALFSAPTSGIEGLQTIVIDSVEDLLALQARLEQADTIAFDVETTSTDAMQTELVGVSLALQQGEGYYIPVGHHPDLAGGPQLPIERVIEALRGPLTEAGIAKVGHNLKYDALVLARHGLRPTPLSFDTMVAEWLCNPASHNLGLKSLAWVRLGIEMTEIQELIGRGRNQRSMAQVSIAQVAPYAAADAEICLRLMPLLEAELEEKAQTALFRELEIPLIPVLMEMELAGIGLDLAFLERLSKELAAKLAELEAEIHRQVGHTFNINSTQQLSKVLFEELGLKPPEGTRRTASGLYSTAASVLESLRQAHPIVDLILQQREIAKLKSTYVDALQAQVNPQTGRVHSSFNQTGSVTGRLASSDPNLQNIPIRSELGRRIRRAFVAAPGEQLLSVDYSQIELRIVAHMAEDQAMIQAFLDDQDIHAATASAIYGVPLQEVTPAMRRHAKAINFGLIYGMSPFGLTRSTDLTLAEAEDFVKAYFERFPGVKGYLERVRQQAMEQGYVETLLGRRRYFPQLRRDGARVSEQARNRALREAVNAPIQGTAADIIKLAMLRLPSALKQAGLPGQMLLQVHDELVLEVPGEKLRAVAAVVQRTMQDAYSLRVPLKTDAKAGPTWADMQPVDA